jgi:hypothetical protein
MGEPAAGRLRSFVLYRRERVSKGLANLLVENLKLCDVYNRPIHFTDVKRDRMYIRDADEWTKHDNNEKLIEVLEISARQACIRLTEWMREHEDVPDYNNLDSELGKQYLALMMNVIRPEVDRLKSLPQSDERIGQDGPVT